MKRSLVLLFFLLSASSFADLGLKDRFVIPEDNDVNVELTKVNQASHIGTRVNILVWNIYKQAKTGLEQELNSLIRDKDIVLLQEGFLTDFGRRIYEGTGLEFIFATSYFDKKFGMANSGVLTGSRFNVVKHFWQRSKHREPIIGTPKMVLFTEYKIENSKNNLLVANIHGINFVRAYMLRDQLDEVAKVLKAHKGPAILGGDFNTWTKTKLNNMYASLKPAGMSQVKFKKSPQTVMGKPLDHVWVRGFKVLATDIPNSKASDHKPLTVELEL